VGLEGSPGQVMRIPPALRSGPGRLPRDGDRRSTMSGQQPDRQQAPNHATRQPGRRPGAGRKWRISGSLRLARGPCRTDTSKAPGSFHVEKRRCPSVTRQAKKNYPPSIKTEDPKHSTACTGRNPNCIPPNPSRVVPPAMRRKPAMFRSMVLLSRLTRLVTGMHQTTLLRPQFVVKCRTIGGLSNGRVDSDLLSDPNKHSSRTGRST
jgi:hypothetical protein